jgi:glycosyltransferase involved in cell wall biosynthesis
MLDLAKLAIPVVQRSDRFASSPSGLNEHFDGVVMLTWSNWRTEPRSNRYHYATRFARSLPVLFVQPDGESTVCSFEETEVPGVTIVHLPPADNVGASRRVQAYQLGMVMSRWGIRRPLLWIYNPFLDEFVKRCYSPLKVYHATEDYFTCERFTPVRDQVAQVVAHCDLIVAVSNGVADSYRQHTNFDGPIHVAPNGCDYEAFVTVRREIGLPPRDTRIALFQGGINWRVDFDLLHDLATRLPDWEFHFCGQASFHPRNETQALQNWQALLTRPNVRYLGYLDAAATARAMCRSTIGLIPFIRDRTIVERSLPLKAYEYVACGLPVVSIPIRELACSPELFALVDTAHDFADCIVRLRESRWQHDSLQFRAEQASRQSYETAFENVEARLLEVRKTTPSRRDRLNVLVLCAEDAMVQLDTLQQLQAFQYFSRHQVLFFPVSRNGPLRFDLALFDALLVHELLLGQNWLLLPASFRDQLEANPGFKALLPMPGTESGNATAEWCKEIGLHQCTEVLYKSNCDSMDQYRSLVAAWDNWLESVLPRSRGARLLTVLAGYESPQTKRCHRILKVSPGSLEGMPGGAPRPSAKSWDAPEKSVSRNWKAWVPNFLRPAVRLVRGFLRSA